MPPGTNMCFVPSSGIVVPQCYARGRLHFLTVLRVLENSFFLSVRTLDGVRLLAIRPSPGSERCCTPSQHELPITPDEVHRAHKPTSRDELRHPWIFGGPLLL